MTHATLNFILAVLSGIGLVSLIGYFLFCSETEVKYPKDMDKLNKSLKKKYEHNYRQAKHVSENIDFPIK